MRLTRREWAEMCGAVGDEGADYGDFSHASGVGFLDAGDYADRVHDRIAQLDRDVQAAISRNEPLGVGFNFNEWVTFTGTAAGTGPNDWGVDPVPFGWFPFHAQLGILDKTLNKDATMARIGRFEERYESFRQTFKSSGGKTDAGSSPHPGIFQTERDKDEGTQTATYVKWALVLAAIGVVGYTVTGFARLKGD